MRDKLRNNIYIVSSILLLFGVIGLFILHLSWFVWIMLIGGFGYTLAHLSLSRDLDKYSFRQKRLIRMAIIAGLLWIIAGVFYIFVIDLWASAIVLAVLFMAYSNITHAILHEKNKEKKH